ncbi:hypothetical protein [Magnetospirillum fulvum]|uniref:Uncharacterized protein n=1 Tax=Magnetospirillum fulvum MGU-K5 TaxID=1316936 RepID=S9TGH1_MAGFU|nr:hypothetical protein [Magnetospirillum fulvum]EPY01386.1 hypothetical protein K678_11331 [Magnetospirillum fulvum MGU-K5]
MAEDTEIGQPPADPMPPTLGLGDPPPPAPKGADGASVTLTATVLVDGRAYGPGMYRRVSPDLAKALKAAARSGG